MRHRAALALVHIEPIAFTEYAAEDASIEILGDDDVIDGNDKRSSD